MLGGRTAWTCSACQSLARNAKGKVRTWTSSRQVWDGSGQVGSPDASDPSSWNRRVRASRNPGEKDRLDRPDVRRPPRTSLRPHGSGNRPIFRRNPGSNRPAAIGARNVPFADTGNEARTAEEPDLIAREIRPIDPSDDQNADKILHKEPIPFEGMESNVGRRRLARRQRPNPRRTADADNIPFESDKAEHDASTKSRSPLNTITGREKAVFEALRRLHRKDAAAPEAQHDPTEASEPGSSPPIPDHVQAPDGGTADIKEPFGPEINSMLASFESAPTDLALWETALGKVFSRAVALKLDPAPPKELLARIKAARGKATREPVDPETFPNAFPQHLTNFMKVMRRRFPGSRHYALQVLATLSDLGPATFALGASTALYNAHMFLLWEKYQDVGRVTRVLEEMDRKVYLYDGGTQRLVMHILEQAEGMRAGTHGDVVRDFSRPSNAEIRQMRGIKRKIVQQREEEALRDAREQYGDDVGWEGEEVQRPTPAIARFVEV